MPAAAERMSRVDTAWLRMDNEVNLMMIVGVWLLTPALTLDALRERIEKFQAAGVVGDQEICRRTITFSLEAIDQFCRARRQQLDSNAGSCRKGIEDRLDEAFRTAGVNSECIGGLDRG